MVKEKEKEKAPMLASPVSQERLDDLKKRVPTGLEIFDIEGEEKTIYDVTGSLLGLQNKDPFSILERTNMTKEEVDVFTDLIQLAEHGIGGPLDMSVPELGAWAVHKLRGRVSIDAKSRQEFENVMTAWVKMLVQREEEAKKKQQNLVGG